MVGGWCRCEVGTPVATEREFEKKISLFSNYLGDVFLQCAIPSLTIFSSRDKDGRLV
jgi:hypothetical protein